MAIGKLIVSYLYYNHRNPINIILMLAVRLPENLEHRLEALAKATGRTKSYYAREAIKEHLDDLEDIYLAEKALEDIPAGRAKVISSDEFWDAVDD